MAFRSPPDQRDYIYDDDILSAQSSSPLGLIPPTKSKQGRYVVYRVDRRLGAGTPCTPATGLLRIGGQVKARGSYTPPRLLTIIKVNIGAGKGRRP